jgi:rubredoxin
MIWNMTDTSIVCPICHAGMEPGVVVGRSPGVKFKRSRGFGDLGGILLTAGIFNHSAAAFRCSSCGPVVIPGR